MKDGNLTSRLLWHCIRGIATPSEGIILILAAADRRWPRGKRSRHLRPCRIEGTTRRPRRAAIGGVRDGNVNCTRPRTTALRGGARLGVKQFISISAACCYFCFLLLKPTAP